MSTPGNIVKSIPLESRPHRTLERGLVWREGDQMFIPDSLFVRHTLEANILTS